MFENVGAGEILVILLVVLIFFGPKKIPELAAGLGKGLRKFNEAKEGLEGQLKTVMKEPMDALNEAKEGFQKHMTEASKSVDETMNPALPAPLPMNPTATATAPVVDAPVAAPPAPVAPLPTIPTHEA